MMAVLSLVCEHKRVPSPGRRPVFCFSYASKRNVANPNGEISSV